MLGFVLGGGGSFCRRNDHLCKSSGAVGFLRVRVMDNFCRAGVFRGASFWGNTVGRQARFGRGWGVCFLEMFFP